MRTSVNKNPAVGIYTGEGASHSWTWFVETLERMGNLKMVFLEESDVCDTTLCSLDMLMIGGGDVAGMAGGIGRRGGEAIDQFVENGGCYFGSCAGAYLVMSGVDLPPYDPFKLIDAAFANYALSPPPPLHLPHKYKVPYGEGYVFHPAYGPVKVAMEEASLFEGMGGVVAPLYGGPAIVPGEGAKTLGRYLGLEKGCFPLAGSALINEVLIDSSAGALAKKGKGQVFIFGPHFECPAFPQGYGVVRKVMEYAGVYGFKEGEAPLFRGRSSPQKAVSGEKAKKYVRQIKGELSNARIVAFGLERMPVAWTIGTKVWEPEKTRYFIEFAWRRLGCLENAACREGIDEKLNLLAEETARVREMIRGLKRDLDQGRETTGPAAELFRRLKRQTVLLLEIIRFA